MATSTKNYRPSDDEPFMNDLQREYFRQKLLRWYWCGVFGELYGSANETRFGLDLPRDDTGYGHSAQDVAKVRASAQLLADYYRAVHAMTLDYVVTVDSDTLGRIVDTRWDPPVTASVRLVSVIDDCAQHLGQAAYVKGIRG